MKTQIKKVFEVERAIQAVGNIAAGKLAYGLARNSNRVKDVTDSARKALKSEDPDARKFFMEVQGKTPAEIEKIRSELESKVAKEVDRIEKAEKELLESDTEIVWYKIPLSDIPGMKDDDPSEKGILPMAIFALLLDVGIIDDNEPEKKRNKKEKKLKSVK